MLLSFSIEPIVLLSFSRVARANPEVSANDFCRRSQFEARDPRAIFDGPPAPSPSSGIAEPRGLRGDSPFAARIFFEDSLLKIKGEYDRQKIPFFSKAPSKILPRERREPFLRQILGCKNQLQVLPGSRCGQPTTRWQATIHPVLAMHYPQATREGRPNSKVPRNQPLCNKKLRYRFRYHASVILRPGFLELGQRTSRGTGPGLNNRAFIVHLLVFASGQPAQRKVGIRSLSLSSLSSFSSFSSFSPYCCEGRSAVLE